MVTRGVSFFTIFLLSLSLTKSSNAYGPLVQLDATCGKYSQVNQLDVKAAMMGHFNPNENLRNYLYCYAQNHGYMLNDREMNNDKIEKIIADVLRDTRLASKIREDCDNTLYDAKQTVFYTFKCYYKYIKDYVSLPDMSLRSTQIHRTRHRHRHTHYNNNY